MSGSEAPGQETVHTRSPDLGEAGLLLCPNLDEEPVMTEPEQPETAAEDQADETVAEDQTEAAPADDAAEDDA